MKRYTLIAQSPSDRNVKVSIPEGLAWPAARGIAKDTHHAVVLIGRYGTARFDACGAGRVEWGPESTCPGEVTRFAENTTVCI